MGILDTVKTLQELDAKSIKIIMGEVGSGKTTFLKDMPDVAGGDILYLPIGSDKGFNQLKSDKRFKTLPQPINTRYIERKGKKISIKDRTIPQLIEVLEEFKEGSHSFRGLTIDAISTIQENIENEVKFDTSKNLEWDDWSSIKKAMFKVYELCEEISELGYEVALQTHFQIREYEDVYTGEKATRLLPMMTEANAIRILKNADAVVMIKVMPDEKDKRKVHRMTIVGGHPTIPTKIRNEFNLSFDGILFENLTYYGLIRLMQISDIDEAADLDNVVIRKDTDKGPKKKIPAKKEDTPPKEIPKKKKPPVNVEEEEDEPVKKAPPKKTPPKKKPPVKEDEPKKKPPKRVQEETTTEVEEEEDDTIVEEKTVTRKNARKLPPKKQEVEEDTIEDDEFEDDEFEDDGLFAE